MILKTSRLIPWCSCLPRRPNCWVVATTLSELQILCLNHRVSCSSRQFLLPLLILVELCHVQWKGCSLCSSSVYQALSSLLSGFPVHNIRCIWFCVCVCLRVCVCFFFLFFQTESQKAMVFAVFLFLELFFSSSIVVAVAIENLLKMPVIISAHNSSVYPNFAQFRGCVW